MDSPHTEFGNDWAEQIRYLISESDIVVVIVTLGALRSKQEVEIEKEVLEAMKQNKRIIPYIHTQYHGRN